MDLFELYQNQDKMKNSELFVKFKKLFVSYFEDNEDYKKDIDGNKYIMINKKNKNNKKIIKPPVYINLNETYYHLKKEVKNIFDKSLYLIENKNKIDESNEIFNNYKLDYKVKMSQIQQCEEIFNDQNKEINKLKHKLIELKLLLGKKYIERGVLYDKIKDKPIKRSSKKELFKLFRNSNLKVPDESTIKKVANKLNVDLYEATHWLEWFEVSKTYIEIQLNIQDNMKEIKRTNDNNELINNNFLIALPTISDKKDINMDVKVPKLYKKGNDVVVKKLE